MLSIFRKGLISKLLLGVLGIVLIAFIFTGVTDTGMFSGMGASAGDKIAIVGGKAIHAGELDQRVRLEYERARRDQPTLDMAAFVNGGGFDMALDQLIAARAIDAWGRSHGFSASERLIDGDIASIQAFRGPTGQFDRQTYLAALAQQNISEKMLREDIGRDAVRRQIILPMIAGTSVPAKLVTPYAALLLEAREGEVGIVPTAALPPGPAPSEAEIAAYYQSNIARFTVPERRVLRYALFGPEQLGALPPPTDAEIAAFYTANAASYAGKEQRKLAQVILPAEAAAKTLADKVKAGTSFAAAAQGAGFSAADIAIGEQSRDSYAELASKDVAAAAFAAAEGATIGPVKSPLGWHVVHIEAIRREPGKPLATVRGEIAAQIAKQKADEAIAALVGTIEDAIGDGSTFDEVVKAQKLTAVTTPPLLPNGAAPDQPAWQPAPELAVLLRSAFESELDDDPTVETIGNGRLHALLDLGQIVPAAPTPLAKVRDAVIVQIGAERAQARAREIAQAIVAKAGAGVPLPTAFAQAPVTLPPVQKAGGRQVDIMRSGREVPPPVLALFSMREGAVQLVPAPENQGWFVVRLGKIVRGDITKQPDLVEATRGEFAKVIGAELIEQFTRATMKEVGVARNTAAIERLKRQLAGGSAAP